MFVSALSITTSNTPSLPYQPSALDMGAVQRLNQPQVNTLQMPPVSIMQQMQLLVGEMYTLLHTLMGNASSSPTSVLNAAPAFTTQDQLAPSNQTANSSGAPATTTDLKNVQGSDFGKKFAAQAEKTANQINTRGLCLKGVNDTMQAMGLPVHREAAAWMALDDFQKNPRFQEVKVSKDQLKSLPAGAVVIWNKGDGLPYGHISVALGGGREASSIVRQQLVLNTEYHVFLPK